LKNANYGFEDIVDALCFVTDVRFIFLKQNENMNLKKKKLIQIILGRIFSWYE